MSLTNEQKIYDNLIKTNIINSAFELSFDLHMARINGVRLGRTALIPVDWDEFNAALGYTVQLTCAIADLIHFKFLNCIIIPHGSKSKIIKTIGQPTQEYDLY